MNTHCSKTSTDRQGEKKKKKQKKGALFIFLIRCLSTTIVIKGMHAQLLLLTFKSDTQIN